MIEKIVVTLISVAFALFVAHWAATVITTNFAKATAVMEQAQ